MLLYASSRFRFRCASATRLPTSIVSAASAAMTTCHCPHQSAAGTTASANSRSVRAKAAALEPIARYAVTGSGAPS